MSEQKCDVYARVCGYIRPVKNFSKGKVAEFNDRKNFKPVSEKEEK